MAGQALRGSVASQLRQNMDWRPELMTLTLLALEEVFPGPRCAPRVWATMGSSELAILSLLKVLGAV